jgi:toxin ParE1/3/4
MKDTDVKEYELTREAEQDLLDVARYTLNNWGEEHLHLYQIGLEKRFNSLSKQLVQHSFSSKFPDLRVTRYRYHYIFYLVTNSRPLIVGVIHEKRDIVAHLKERLESS